MKPARTSQGERYAMNETVNIVRLRQPDEIDDRLTDVLRKPRGERISSVLVEATVNAVVSKRFAKKQQMQWSRTGAHLQLQTRTQTLDGSLRATFERWYPGMANDNHRNAGNRAAA